LKDFETVERRLDRAQRTAKNRDKDLVREAAQVEALRDHLGEGLVARRFRGELAPSLARELSLLTAKPVLYAANVADDDLPHGNDHVDAVAKLAEQEGAELVVVSAQVEAELVDLPPDERAEYLASVGLEASGLQRLIEHAYRLLGLLTFFTAGPKETRAWTVPAGSTAPRAAREIHTDFERGFIRAEVITFDDYDRLGSEAAARVAGRLRVEGKDYIVADGDVIHFRFNV